jgi:hypothetical protein
MVDPSELGLPFSALGLHQPLGEGCRAKAASSSRIWRVFETLTNRIYLRATAFSAQKALGEFRLGDRFSHLCEVRASRFGSASDQKAATTLVIANEGRAQLPGQENPFTIRLG